MNRSLLLFVALGYCALGGMARVATFARRRWKTGVLVANRG